MKALAMQSIINVRMALNNGTKKILVVVTLLGDIILSPTGIHFL